MAKKPNQKKSAEKKNKAMSAATRIFAAGACAEIYLLAVYRYYVRGTANQMLTWHNRYLPALPWIGAAVAACLLLVAAIPLLNRPLQRNPVFYANGTIIENDALLLGEISEAAPIMARTVPKYTAEIYAENDNSSTGRGDWISQGGKSCT